MRFLILTQYYPPEVGAAQVRLAALAHELKEAGHSVEVVTGMPNHPEGEIRPGYRRRVRVTETIDGVPVHRVWLYAASGSGARRVLNYLSFTVSCVLALVPRSRPDVIFVESPPPFLMVPAVMFGLVWRRPIVMNVADLWPDSATGLGLLAEGSSLTRALIAFERWAYRRARWVCAVTDGVRDVLERDKSVPAERLVDLPNGVDTALFSPRPGDRSVLSQWHLEDRRVLLYAGTVGYAHGVETAVDAMVQLKETHPDAHLLIVGGGSMWDAVAERVAECGATNVTLARPVPLEVVADLLAVTTAAVSTLRDSPLFEGTRPSKLFPAFAAGVPVLYSGAGEGARIVAEHDVGLVTAPEDAAALADAARSLLDDDDLAERLGANGRRLAVERFSWATIVPRWLGQLRYEGAPVRP